MTREEKDEATAEALEELDEWKETNGTTRHNSHIAAFHDASKTIAGIEEDVSGLIIISCDMILSEHSYGV